MHEASSSQSLNTEEGAAVYSPGVLKLYDWWVLGLSNRFAWKCPTETVLLPFYKQYMGRRHLDVGVGTGFYPANANRKNLHQITLLDLNENSLRTAAARLKQRDVRTIKQDVMSSPFDLQDERYDSISLFYLLHCLPGTMEDKEIAIANLKRYLSRNGVLYGVTILGEKAAHNPFGRLLMKTYNRKGAFSNQADTRDDLQKILSHHFGSVQIRQHNTVALFVARDPVDDGR